MAQLVAQITFNDKGAERPFRVQVTVPAQVKYMLNK